MSASLEQNALVGGTYRVTGRLGQGGMGDVFRVRHERTGASYALKVLNSDLAAVPELLSRFQREAEVTSSLNHPNLVRVFDFDRLPDGRPYLVMELLEGDELTGVIRNAGGRLPLGRVVNLIGQMAMGLAAAHERGIVHRDLKPSNVFVTPLPGSKQELVRILDFGISKVSGGPSQLTRTSAIMGTPNYMSPEQARGQTSEIDHATDQWAVAAMAYEMLAGRLAFLNEEGPLQVLWAVVNDEPPTLRSLGVEAPAGIEAVIGRGLAKDKRQRFESVTAFSRALTKAARDGGVGLAEADADQQLFQPGDTLVAPSRPSAPGLPDAPGKPGLGSAAPLPTTLGQGTGERVLTGVADDGDDDGDGGPRRRPLVGVGMGIGVGVAAIGAIVFLLNGNHKAPLAPPSAAPQAAAGAPEAPAPGKPQDPAPAAPSAAPTNSPPPLASPTPPASPTPQASPAPAVKRAEREAPPVRETATGREPSVARPTPRPAHRDVSQRKRRTEDAPKRVINEDL
jgi:tRNA A-37 threonylcarbamoyl transferase component Bud32